MPDHVAVVGEAADLRVAQRPNVSAADDLPFMYGAGGDPRTVLEHSDTSHVHHKFCHTTGAGCALPVLTLW